MKKKLIPLLMASLCMMSLFGCSGNSASTENETSNPTSPESTETEVNSENPDSESVEYISSIFTSPERQILFDTYGTAKDSNIEEILIAENGTLTIFEDYEGTLGDIAQKTDDEIYNELQSLLSVNTTEYMKYDLSKAKVIYTTDTTGNNVMNETILFPVDSIVAFNLNNSGLRLERTYSFDVNQREDPLKGLIVFSCSNVYESSFQDCYCLSSKRYLMERIDSDTKPTNYYPDNTNGELAMESFRDIDITTLTSGGTMLENQIKITKPDGSCYAFENITYIDLYYNFQEGNSLIPWDDSLVTTQEEEYDEFNADEDGNGILDRYEGGDGGM